MTQRFLPAAMLLLGAAACASDSTNLTAPAAAPPSATPTLDVSSSGGFSTTGQSPLVSAIGQTLCADVWSGSRAAGASVVTWTCHTGENQQLTFQASGEITLYDGAMCLDAWTGQGNNGDKIVIWPCHGGANQKWTRTSAGEVVGINGKCLDVWGADANRGAKLVIWACHGGANQKWTAPGLGASVVPVPTQPLVPAPSAPTVGSAELPRTFLDTPMPAVTGRTIHVAAGANLQAALDAAQPGDEVVLAPGATFVGSFVLRAKAGTAPGQWITVRSGGALPAEGTRVGPGDAAQMAKLLTPNNFDPALYTAAGAQGWRVIGIEISSVPGTTWNYSFVNLGTTGPQNTPASVPSRLVLDRVYVHAHPSFALRRCVGLNSASTAIINSYLADCHSNESDSQAIVGSNGPGPFKIVNNHLEGGHEVVMFGGSDPYIQDLVPSDIELRRNHVTRPTSWRGVWQAKNLLELKNARRVLAEGNVFENNWADAQTGFALVFFSVNQEGRCSWCVVEDVTVRYNRIVNTPQGVSLADYQGPSAVAMRRVTLAHNVITGLTGRAAQVIGNIAGVTFANNTALGVSADMYFATSWVPLPSFVFRDNVTGGQYTLFADGGYEGPRTLAQMQIPAANVTGNVFRANWTGNVPSGNAFAASVESIGFANFAGGDLALSASSPFLSSGTGGSRPGADFTTLAQLSQGAVR